MGTVSRRFHSENINSNSSKLSKKMYKIIFAAFILATISDALADDLPDLVDAAIATEQLKKIVKAVNDVGLTKRFKAIPAVTIFAPADQVFEAIEAAKPGFVDSLSRKKKVALLSRHTIVGKKLKTEDLTNGPVTTFGKEVINVLKKDGKVYVQFNGKTAEVIQSDIIASNGVIHIINNLLA